MKGIKWGQVHPNEQHDKIIIVASGPSLENFDFNKLREKGHIICVNNSGNHVPFADSWFTLDPWGLNGPQLPTNFAGKLYAAVPDEYGRRDCKVPQYRIYPNPRIIFLHRLISHNFVSQSSETAYVHGLSPDRRCISTGNSGYGAFNLAFHMKPKKILLLGIDGSIGYFYTKTERNRPLTSLPKMFNSTVHQMKENNIEVINGSINSTVNCFPRYSINEALEIFEKD